MRKDPKVFISYSHDDAAHRQRVLDLANQLTQHGVYVYLDQFEPTPADGWQRWMERSYKEADFVLLICTETYRRRFEQEEDPGRGLGVRWESILIASRMYQQPGQAARFIPILLGGSDTSCIPATLFASSRYEIRTVGLQDPGYEGLYRHLTAQPATERPGLGEMVILGRSGSDRPASPLTVAPPLTRAGPAAAGEGGRVDMGRGPRALRFRIRASDTAPSGFTVELTSRGLDPAEIAFACDPWQEKQTKEALEKIDQNRCLRDDLAYVGSQLWSGMVHGAVQERVEGLRRAEAAAFFHVRLRLPRRLEELPWEALYDPRDGFMGTSERYCIIRDVPEDLPAPAAWSGAGRPVGVLVILPEGSGLDLATEQARIQERARPQGSAVRVEVLSGRVTPDRLREVIGRGGWDVVHFAGHARATDQGEVQIRLNSPDEEGDAHWMEAQVFATLFNAGGVRLIVFNCCRAATPYSGRVLGGLGPFLLRKGVPAVIAMRFDLPDPTALRFADEFYRVLLGGPEPGRVDVAMEKARVVIYQNQTDRTVRDFLTPTLYLAPGHERAFELAPPAASIVAPAEAKPTGPAVTIPGDLRAALIEGRCVPVLGPGLLAADATRDEAPPPGPCDLARRLAMDSSYHPGELFDLAARAGPWIDATLLQWVCQHYHVQRKIRSKMLNTIQQAFRSLRPSPTMLAIATWRVPGFICTYFDGLLQQSLQDRSRPVQVLNSLRDEVTPDPDAALLVHLRGTWADPTSLVLTEEHHHVLWDRLANPPTRLANLIKGYGGRSLLFLGVAPRDPLARRLVAKLIPEEQREAGAVGPVYFAASDPSDDDQAYWQEYGTEWLRDPLADLVATLTAESRPEAAR